MKSGWMNTQRRSKRRKDGKMNDGGGIDVKTWKRTAKRLSKFGIQCGVFQCDNDEK